MGILHSNLLLDVI